jgi:hypothetical protein
VRGQELALGDLHLVGERRLEELEEGPRHRRVGEKGIETARAEDRRAQVLVGVGREVEEV